MRYAIVIEKAEGNYSAYAPDLPGCVATGATIAEVELEMREAIAFTLKGCARTACQCLKVQATLSTLKSPHNGPFQQTAAPLAEF